MKKKKDVDLDKSFTRRALFVGAVQGGLLAVLGGRLAFLQLVEGNRYKTLANKNRINLKMLAPSRGLILDRAGVNLAENGQNFRVLAIPEQADDFRQSLLNLRELVDLGAEDIEGILKKAKTMANFVPLEVKDNLSWEEVAKIEVNLPDLPGLSIDVGEVRSYPFGAASAHFVGYVGAVSKAELGEDPVLSLPGFKIGKTGLEKTYDKTLRGHAGTAEVEVNVVGREVRELSRNPSAAGENLYLSIDSLYQQYVQKRLETERSASAVVMDAQTGAVYAMASHPSFDPNLFTRRLSAERWEELLADPGHPLNNKAVSGQYPPGSTFKMVTAMAALEAGVVNSQTTVHCPGHYDYGEDRFHCWKRGGHGSMNLVSALEQSCDTFFYKVSTEVGIDKIADMARRLGIGHRLGFDLQEERPGLMPDKNWKRGHFGTAWQPGETIIASIGQGYILATPMQMAVMTARLVNGGKAVKPWLVGAVGNEISVNTNWSDLGLTAWHLNLIRKGMYSVVNGKKGTAQASQIGVPGIEMGGKTGTAQVRRITSEMREEGVLNEDLPWKFRHHALFVGYAPVSKPRYVCSVVVEHGGGGSVTAAPIAKDLLQKVQELRLADKPLIISRKDGRTKGVGGIVRPLRKPDYRVQGEG